MLRLSEILRLSKSVNSDWQSPVADAAAALWGMPPGSARYWRSSATHVFVIPEDGAGSGKRYLRFVPAGTPHAAKLERGARQLAAWAEAGAPVVAPLPTATGKLTETVETSAGALVATLVPMAPGREIGAEELTEPDARSWGRALASLHDSQPSAGTSGTSLAHEGFVDAELSDAIGALEAAVARQDTNPAAQGVLHGDFELDNLRFDASGPVAFDADETRSGYFAADVAAAVRDLVDPETGLPSRPEMLAAFLNGYRQVRAFSEQQESALPLHAALFAAHTVLDLEKTIDVRPDLEEPEWLRKLVVKLRLIQAQARKHVLAGVARASQELTN